MIFYQLSKPLSFIQRSGAPDRTPKKGDSEEQLRLKDARLLPHWHLRRRFEGLFSAKPSLLQAPPRLPCKLSHDPNQDVMLTPP